MSRSSSSSYTNEDVSPFSGGVSFASMTREREGRNVRKRRICLVWGCLILAILLVVGSVAGAIALRYTLGIYGDEYQMFPGDTRITHVPSDFCEELVVTASEPEGLLQLQITEITSTPPLGPVNGTAKLSSSFTLSSYKTFVLHLHQNSTVELWNRTTGSVWVFILYDDYNYQTWLSSTCKTSCFNNSAQNYNSPRNGTHQLNIIQDTNLYIVFWLDVGAPNITVDLVAELGLTEYQVSSSSSLPNCTADGREQAKQCSLSVPYKSSSSSTLFLVKALLTSEVDTFSQTETVVLTCKQRVWIYVVFVAPAIVVLMTAISILVAHCCCLIREKRRTAMSLPDLLATDNDSDWLNEL